MRKVIFAFLIVSSIISTAQELIPTKKTQRGFVNIDYLSVKMPNDILGNPEENMGLGGIHYNLFINKWLYGGFGFYGSVHGKRGGLFTLGVNAGIRKELTSKLFIDAGFHFGGGGGASAPDGGGAFILPHLNIGYQFDNFSATAGYSYINFFDKGAIKSHQFNVAVQIPVHFDYANFQAKEKRYTTGQMENSDWNQASNKTSLLVHLNNLSPYGGSVTTAGASLDNATIRLVGFELNSYLSNNWFVFFKADGAYSGIKSGYMDILFGGGYHLSFNRDRTNILTKFGIGAGGGGGVHNAGGFFIYPDISLEQKLFDRFYIAINKGLLLNPSGVFKSSTLGFGLKYYVNQQGISATNQTFITAKFKGIEAIIGHDIYFGARRIVDPTEDLHQISLQFNIYFNKYIYGAGKTSFASFGNAGAYAEGLVGLGVRSTQFANKKLSLFAQGLVGAAGGGDISTGEGLIIKPSAGLYYALSDKLNIRSEFGWVKARGGTLNSAYLNFGLSYQIGILTSK